MSSQITASTRLVSVIGSPIHHSLSPLIHNAAFQAQGLDMAYVACQVLPQNLASAVEGWKALGFAGSNVTLPHKQALVPFMDELSDAAQAVKAVNTVVCQPQPDGSVKLYGDNTDVMGFITPLLPMKQALQGKEVAVFGAGGAMRAVVYALLTYLDLSKVHLVVRNVSKGEVFAQEMKAYDPKQALHVVEWDSAARAVQESTLLVNGTPIGMYPNVTDSPWERVDFGAHHVGYDLIYNPMQTQFLKDIANVGGQVISGVEMFIGQAAAAYRQWTHQDMPLDVVRRVLAEWRK